MHPDQKELLDYAKHVSDISAVVATEKVLMENGLLKSYYTQRELHRKVGRRKVEFWEKNQLVTPIKQGSNTTTIMYLREEVNNALHTEVLLSHPMIVGK